MKSRPLLKSEILNILERAKNVRDKAIIVVSSCTGFRISELMSLKISQVAVFKNGVFIGIQAVIYQTGKGGKMRSVRINKLAIKTLTTLVKSQLRKGATADDYVFTAINTKSVKARSHLTRGRCHVIIKGLVNSLATSLKNGLSHHSFRKYAAQCVYNVSKDILLVKAFLNHSNIQTTLCYLSDGVCLFSEDVLESLNLEGA